MNLAGYRFNPDALLARVIYRWRGRAILALLLPVALLGLGSGLVPPIWKGRVDLKIIAAPGATVHVDGRAWPHQLYAGRHTILATLPDGRGAWADVDLAAGTTLALTLPAGLPEPRERALPPAAPGTHIAQVWWADDAWRVLSVPNPPPTPDARHEPVATPTPQPGQIVAVNAQRVERLATLDAYAGLADQVHVGSQLREAVYHPNRSALYGNEAAGTLEVRGWAAAVQTIPISSPLTLVRFAPNGGSLLLAEQVESGGAQVYLAQPGKDLAPVVAVPGQIVRLSWRPDGQAVVIHSLQSETLTLTLVRLSPSLVAAAIADLPATQAIGALVPLTWDNDGLLWVAPDDTSVPTLWHAPLSTLIPERRGPLDARALTRLPDGTLRVVTVQGANVVIGRYEGSIFVGETVVPRVQAAADLVGIWQGEQLLLQSHEGVWLLDVTEGRS